MKILNIDSNPTWEDAVTIYIECLENPNVKEKNKKLAREEILELARAVDKHQGN